VATITLEAQARTIVGKKVNALRNQGLVPGTIYGPKQAALSVSFPYRALELALRDAGSTNLIDIQYEGQTIPVVARSVQRHIIKGNIMHVDFFAVDFNSKIRVEVPLNIVNESPIVAARRAMLMTGASSVRLELLPGQLMNKLDIDISVIKSVGDAIYMKDLQLAEGVSVLNEPMEMIARAVQTGAMRAAAAAAAAEE
jgi:large subunit ribosomal protein L25